MKTFDNIKSIAALRGIVYAVAGYLVVLAGGKLLTSTTGDGDTFGDLGVAAVTLVLLAPLAALIGASIAFAPYRTARLSGSDPMVFWSLVVVVLAATIAVAARIGYPAGIMTLLIGAAVLVILRTALVEHAPNISSQAGRA